MGNLGTLLVVGGLAAVAMGALRKFEFETEGEFKLGDYETEVGFDFEVDKLDKDKKRRGRDRPNPKDQPNQIDTDKPILVPENVDMFPYYNRNILW